MPTSKNAMQSMFGMDAAQKRNFLVVYFLKGNQRGIVSVDVDPKDSEKTIKEKAKFEAMVYVRHQAGVDRMNGGAGNARLISVKPVKGAF